MKDHIDTLGISEKIKPFVAFIDDNFICHQKETQLLENPCNGFEYYQKMPCDESFKEKHKYIISFWGRDLMKKL